MRRGAPTVRLGVPKFERTDRFHANERCRSDGRSHALLVEAHVEADLHVYEGMWHAFFIYPELPESAAAYSVIVRFFDKHLGS
jgi:acetyl esterase/lipase